MWIGCLGLVDRLVGNFEGDALDFFFFFGWEGVLYFVGSFGEGVGRVDGFFFLVFFFF